MARKYYYDTGDEKIGPVTGNDLVRLRAQGEIDNETWVRRAESKTWRHLGGINLQAEEEEEANPGLLKQLLRMRNCWVGLIFLAAALVAMGMVFYYAWPFLLVVLLIYLFWQAVKA